MTLHQLEIFAKVAELGSFTQAAEALRVRQPTVSIQIKGLEREYDVKLFEKVGNKVRLTGAGERLLNRAEEVLARMESIKEEMKGIKGVKEGEIRVGATTLAAVSFLPAAAQRFEKLHPGIRVVLTVQRSEILEKKVLQGELDLAITSWLPRSRALAGEHFYDEEVVAIAAPNHPLAKRRSVPLELIAKEPLIAYKEGAVRDSVRKRFAEKKMVFAPMLEVDIREGGRYIMKGAVAGNLGIGFLSKSYVAPDIKAGKLKILKVPELQIKRVSYIVVHKNKQEPSLVGEFVSFLKRYRS